MIHPNEENFSSFGRACIAVDYVAEGVAGEVQSIGRRPIDSRQRLDLALVLGQRPAHHRIDRVVPAIGILHDHVAGIADDIGVIATEAGHDVAAAAAIEQVGACIP